MANNRKPNVKGPEQNKWDLLAPVTGNEGQAGSRHGLIRAPKRPRERGSVSVQLSRLALSQPSSHPWGPRGRLAMPSGGCHQSSPCVWRGHTSRGTWAPTAPAEAHRPLSSESQGGGGAEQQPKDSVTGQSWGHRCWFPGTQTRWEGPCKNLGYGVHAWHTPLLGNADGLHVHNHPHQLTQSGLCLP